jgi:hypothetical protein
LDGTKIASVTKKKKLYNISISNGEFQNWVSGTLPPKAYFPLPAVSEKCNVMRYLRDENLVVTAVLVQTRGGVAIMVPRSYKTTSILH